ncbi:substrate-binding periplasmic protein [Bdellovibrio svalbardensis]|uniref:Transporter substrate-binding domain-containing protein n=1 Tax=Bdellovibrio svalbardensis TaxID=2972972 RepID=A0ABT6DGK2_9BACT|nr:transporter substrate-binding domain-containing protein [Bdellovibrio svalbardensis]MDG0815965.1 transporter substrate-binding domain-containing protein [Bdellovibrio svalbardensis]
MRLLIFLTLFFANVAQATVVISTEDDWAPWSSKNSRGQAVGQSVEHVRKIFKILGISTEFKAVPFSRCLIEAEEGRTLGCFHTAKTAKNIKMFDFPQLPLVEDDVLIYTTTPPGLGASQLSDLKGQRVGVTLGYAYSPEFDAMAGIQREESKADLTSFRQLVGDRVPYIAIFKGAAESLLATHPELHRKNLRYFTVGKAQFYLAFSKKYPNSQKLLLQYNQAAQRFPTLRVQPLQVTVYGDRAYPPYSYVTADGLPAGIYVELLQEVFANMKQHFSVKLEMVPWSRGLQLLETGAALALFPPYRIPSRTYIDVYSEPFNTERVVFYCSDPKLKEHARFPDSFRGLKVAITQGFVLDRRLAQQFEKGAFTRVDVLDNTQGLIQLANHNVDCYINDSFSVEWAFANLKQSKHPVLQKFSSFNLSETFVLSEQPAYLAFSENSRFHDKQQFIKVFNTQLKKILAEGRMTVIKSNYTAK